MADSQPELNNKALIRNLIEASDRGDMSAVDRYYSPHYLDHNPSAGRATAEGIEGVRRAFAMFHDAFPDTRHEILDLVAEGDRVVTRIRAKATHSGEIMGIPATGKEVTLEAISIYRIADEKIAERWCFQGEGILEQLRRSS